MSRTLVALAALVCSGCFEAAEEPAGTPAPPPAPSRSANRPADTLVVAWPMDFRSLLVVVQESNEDAEISAQLTWDPVRAKFEGCQLHAEPGWASEWSFSEDGRTLSLTIPEGLKWEDGKPVTVQDLALAFELAGDPQTTSPRFSTVDKMVPGKRPFILDPTHVQFEYKGPSDQDMMLFSISSLPAVPTHALGGADRATLRAHPLSSQPLSTGPWRLAAHEPGQRIVLEPNPAFTGPAEMKPKLERVIFRIIPDYQSRVLALEAGEVDHVRNLQVADAERIAKTYPDIGLHRRGWRAVEFVMWNQSRALFQDKDVRTALALATDVDAMIASQLTTSAGESYAKRAVGNITPELCETVPDNVTPLPFDLPRAKALMAKAGWTDTNGDGVLDRGGEKFQFTLGTNAGNQRRAAVSVMMQANLKELGVVVDLEPLDANTLGANLRGHDFDAVLMGWAGGLFVDPSSTWKCSTPEHPVTFNYGSFCHEEIDALIDRGMATPKFSDAAPIWKEMQAKIYEDQPMLFLYWMDEIVAVDKRVENVSVDLISSLSHLHEWDVPGVAPAPSP